MQPHKDPTSSPSTFASSTSREKEYTRGNQQKQQAWLDESERVINHFLLRLERDEFKSFDEVVSWMGQERCLIAIKFVHGDFHDIALKQKYSDPVYMKELSGVVSKNPHWYLEWQKQKKLFNGPLLYGRPKGKLKSKIHQKETVADQVDNWLNKSQRDRLFASLEKLTENPSTDFECKTEHTEDGTSHKITFKFPEPFPGPHSDPILEILFINRKENREATFIHPTVLKDVQDGNLSALNNYWQKLKNWNVEEGIEVFFQHMAKIAHLSACLPYFDRGTSSVVEWLMRGIAYNKGIYLGPFSSDMSWDFKAFYTPCVAEYAQWLQEKAFTKLTYFDANLPENIAAGFSFTKPPITNPAPVAKKTTWFLLKELDARIAALESKEPDNEKSLALREVHDSLRDVNLNDFQSVKVLIRKIETLLGTTFYSFDSSEQKKSGEFFPAPKPPDTDVTLLYKILDFVRPLAIPTQTLSNNRSM
jgi:hypothetical protein